MVKGLGETLVGAYPGRALSFICKKNDLNTPQVSTFHIFSLGLNIKVDMEDLQIQVNYLLALLLPELDLRYR